MKIALSDSSKAIQLVANKKAPIPFKVEDKFENKKSKSKTFKLCMKPNSATLPMYLLTVDGFDMGLPEDQLALQRQGDIFKAFDVEMSTNQVPAMDNIKQCPQACTMQEPQATLHDAMLMDCESCSAE
eukprot:15365946-Ditylum_brightwellii.AAC.2